VAVSSALGTFWLARHNDPELPDGTRLSVVVSVWSSSPDDQKAANEVFRVLGKRGLDALHAERMGPVHVSEVNDQRGEGGLLRIALVKATGADPAVSAAYQLGGWAAVRDVLRAAQLPDALAPPRYP
jgi:hypothetical protein